jgi:hypothetical protein
MDLEKELENILVASDRAKAATPVAGQEWDELYPSLKALREAKADSKIPHGWDTDPRTLESSFYPSMRKKPGSQ